MSRKQAQFPTVAQRDARRSQTNPRMTSSSSKNAWRNYDPKTFASERSRVSREEHIESVGQDYMGDLLEKYKRTPRGGAGGGRRENTQASEEPTPRQKRRAAAEKTTTTPRAEQWAELARAQRAERERQEAERQRQLERQEAERRRQLEAEQMEKDRRKLARELERLPTIDKLKTPRVQV